MADNNSTYEPRVNGPTPPYGVEGGEDEGSLLAMFGDWEKELEAHWDTWKEEARVCYDFVAGKQYTDAEKAEFELGPDGASRIPVVFNRVAPTVDAVCGAEIQGRQQVQYYPREVGDTGVADVLTQGVDFLMDNCDANEEDSEAFRDCLICGVGIVEIRIDMEEGETNIIKERIDPLEVLFSPSARKACFEDARYLRREKRMSLEEFGEMFPGEEDNVVSGQDITPKKPVIVDPRVRYTNGMQSDYEGNDVTVCEWQWREKVKKYLVPHPDQSGKMLTLNADEHDEVQQSMAQVGAPPMQSQSIDSWHYRRAFVSGDMILMVEDMPVNDFSYKATTGKRDRNAGIWYGLVRPMLDPQRFANKYFSQILHIINSNAKGGVMLEEGAVEDIRQFESSWADTQLPTIVKDGALSNANGPRIANKPTTPYPAGSERMLELSTNAIRDVTGVNQEMLGLADREQPGILEQHRKQAAYGILAAFFDNTRRSLKMQGRLILKLMQKYISPDKLVRIVGEQGSPQYVPLALDPSKTEYDVGVDEAPAGPNQKTQVFQMLIQMMPLLQNADLPGSVWADLLQYSPLPASLAQKISKALNDQAQQEAQAAPAQQQAQQAAQSAEIAEKQGQAAHHFAQAEVLKADAATKAPNTQISAAETSSKAALNRSQTGLNVSKMLETMSPKEEADV